MPDQADNIGEVFVSVGADLTKLRTDMVQARTEAVAGAKKISDAISKSVSARYPGELSGFGTGPLRNPIFTQRGAELDRMMYGDARRSASSTPTTAERDLYQQGDRERGMAVERQMREEQKQGHRQAALEAKEAARVARLAWKEAQRAAVEHAEELRRRWAATRAYLLGDLAKIKVFGNSLWSDLSGGASKAFSIIGGAAKVFFAPWTVVLSTVKALVPLMLLGVGAATAFGGASLKAAASWEELTTRVRHMVGSEQGMQALVKQADYIQARTRFANTDALNALALMKSAGVEGRQAAAGIANMASVTQSTMSSAAQQIMSGRAFMLRRYGIEQARDKGEMIVRFKMPTGREVVLTAKSFSENIKNILQAVNMKFAGAAVAAAKTMAGIFSTIRNLFMDGVRQFGMGLLPFGKAVGTLIINRMNELIASGKLKEWGEDVGKWLIKAFNWFGAILLTIPTLWAEVVRTLREAPEKFGTAVAESFKLLGQGLADVFLTAFNATVSFWVGVGKLLGGVITSTINDWLANSGLPGASVANAVRRGSSADLFNKYSSEYSENKWGGPRGPGITRRQGWNAEAEAWDKLKASHPELSAFSSFREFQTAALFDQSAGPDVVIRGFEGEFGGSGRAGIERTGTAAQIEAFNSFRQKAADFQSYSQQAGGQESMRAGLGTLQAAGSQIRAELATAAEGVIEGLKTIWKDSGIDWTKVETELLLNLFKMMGISGPFLKSITGGDPGDDDGEKKTEAVGAEVRSTSFADWVKVAQEAALKKKDSDHLAGIDLGVQQLVKKGGGFQWAT